MSFSLCGGVLALAAALHSEPGRQRYEFSHRQMGVDIRLVLYASDKQHASMAAAEAWARVDRLNELLSDYDANSELNRLGRTSGTSERVAVSNDLWNVLIESQRLSQKTEGAFDVTVGPYVKLWRRARRSKLMPTDKRLAAARAAVGYRFLQLDACRQTVELTRPAMQLDLGGIAKGYAADQALEILARHGIRRALIDAGGDITVGDPPPGQQGWQIGVAAATAGAPPDQFVLLRRAGIATSGDAWQYVEIDGRRYSHIIDPRTGLGLTDRSSVTVIARDGTTADSLASAVSVLGPARGMALIEATPGAAAVMVRHENGRRETHESTRMKAYWIDHGCGTVSRP